MRRRPNIILIGIVLFLGATILPHAHAAYAAETEMPITGVSDETSTIDVADIEIDDHKDVISVTEVLVLVTSYNKFRKVVSVLVIVALIVPAFQYDSYAAQISEETPHGEEKNISVRGIGAISAESAHEESVKMLSDDISDGNATNNDVSGDGTEPPKESKPTPPAGVTTKAAWSNCTISAPQMAQAGTGFYIRLIGDRQDEVGKYDGETKFVPASWEIKGAPFGSYTSTKPFTTPYDSLVTLKNAGTYTITAKYKAFTFMSDVGWTEDAVDFEYVKRATIHVPLTVLFSAQGGSVPVPSIQLFLAEKCDAFPAPLRKKYKFTGWYRSPNGEAADLVRKNDSIAMLNTSKATSVTLYAHYSKSIKVRFKANGGKVKKKSKRVTYVTTYGKKTYGKLPKPTRKGYYFAGWYTKKKGGKYISAYSDVRTKKDITLYAHWVR